MRKEWEELAGTMGLGSSIVFKGHIDEIEKKELLSMCNSLVLPSVLEGFGRVILEALLCISLSWLPISNRSVR